MVTTQRINPGWEIKQSNRPGTTAFQRYARGPQFAVVRRCEPGAGQFIQHHALIESGSGDLGQNVGGDVLAAREVTADGALINAKGLARLFGVATDILSIAPITTATGHSGLTFADQYFLAPDVMIGTLGVRQFG